jgi:hypothetical protein
VADSAPPAVPKKARGKLVKSMAIPSYEDEIVSIIDTLPPADELPRCELRVGVLNQYGYVYREVRLGTELDLLHFSARMNALGFSQIRPDRDGTRSPYARIFCRRTRTTQGKAISSWLEEASEALTPGRLRRRPS